MLMLVQNGDSSLIIVRIESDIYAMILENTEISDKIEYDIKVTTLKNY